MKATFLHNLDLGPEISDIFIFSRTVSLFFVSNALFLMLKVHNYKTSAWVHPVNQYRSLYCSNLSISSDSIFFKNIKFGYFVKKNFSLYLLIEK